MSRQSIVLLSDVPPVVVHTSNPVRVDAWYSNVQNISTLAVVASNFRGRLTVQASIKVCPTDNDWFPILLNGLPALDYPRAGVPDPMTGGGGGFSGGTSSLYGGGIGGETSTLSFSFTGRFIWMRAIVDRSFIVPMDANPIMIGACGLIDRILLNV